MCQHLQAIYQAWARSSEVGIPVYEINLAILHRPHVLPLVVARKQSNILQRPFNIEAAAGENNHIGIRSGHPVPGQGR